jgi:hypothetical protein
MLMLLAVVGLPLLLLFSSNDPFAHKLQFALMLGAFFSAFCFLGIVDASGTKNFLNSFIFSKEIILKNNHIIVNILSGNRKEYLFDCHPENSPRATSRNRTNQNSILISSSSISVSLGAGMNKPEIDEIIDAIQEFIRRVDKKFSETPSAVAATKESLDSFGHAILEEEPEVEDLEEDDIIATAEKRSPSPKSIEIFQDDESTTIITKALWGPLKWFVVSALFCMAVALICLLVYHNQIGGFSVSISFTGGLAFVFMYFMDIKLRIDSKMIVVTYGIFHVLSWRRNIQFADIIAVGDNWDGACAIHTMNRSFRVSHFTTIKSRNYLKLLICETLQKQASWKKKKRFNSEYNGNQLKKIRVMRTGMRVLEELNLNLPAVLFGGVVIVPILSGLFILFFLFTVADLLSFPENFIEHATPYVIMIFAFCYIGAIVRLMKSPMALSVEKRADENDTPSSGETNANLVVTRCFWGERYFRSEFPLQDELNVSIEQLDGDFSIPLQKGVCVIAQKDKRVRFGAVLDWDELLELKKEIENMIDSARTDSSLTRRDV